MNDKDLAAAQDAAIEQANTLGFDLELIKEKALSIDIEMPRSAKEAFDLMDRAFSKRAQATAEIGFYLLYLQAEWKQSPDSGLWSESTLKQEFEKRGITKQRAYEFVAVAKMLLQLPDKQRRKILGIGKSKMIQLAKIDPHELAEALDDNGEFDEIDQMSWRELKDTIRYSQRGEKRMSEEINQLRGEVGHLKNRHIDTKLPPLLFDLRVNTAAQCQAARTIIEELTQQLVSVTEGTLRTEFHRIPAILQDHAKNQMHVEIDLLYAQLHQLRMKMKHDFMPDKLVQTNLTEAEHEAIVERHLDVSSKAMMSAVEVKSELKALATQATAKATAKPKSKPKTRLKVVK